MRKIVLICLFAPLFAVNLITYNIYDRNERVDIMLSFDKPFDGKISQKIENGANIITLSNVEFKEDIEKTVNSPILQNLAIEKVANAVNLVLWSDKKINAQAAMTKDKFGLRVRITNQFTPAEIPANPNEQSLKFAQDDLLSQKYIIVIAFLVAMTLISWIIKRIFTKNSKKNMHSYGTTQRAVTNLFKNDKNDLDIVFKKPIDAQNSVVLFKYENRKYLLLVGTTSVLLDKFGADNIKTDEDFQVFFEENKQRLGKFLQERREQNPISTYSSKAARV